MLRAVLFDFDGTLADTAPDLGGALNRLRAERGLEALPLEAVRAHASSGARGLLGVGFGLTSADADYEPMRQAFLAHYEAYICQKTVLFPGTDALLAEISARGLAWGIVTNKSTRLTTMILKLLPLTPPPACVVCGDSTPHLKPHPAPLLLAAEQLRLAPADCIYLGDDRRDIQSAHAAGMQSVAVEYGYHGTGNGGPANWGAHHVIAQPLDLLRVL